MTGIFHMFLFVIVLFSVFLLYAFIDHRRFRSRAGKYLESRLGLYGTTFQTTRFVRMARVVQEESRRLVAVFPLHGRHLFIDDFFPEILFDLPPDGVILSDGPANRSTLFLEQKKQVFFARIPGFAPDEACYVRRGAGTIVFGVGEIPGSVRDWFLVDRKNARTGWLLQEPQSRREYSGFLVVSGFAPEEGELQDEKGRTILADWVSGTIAVRDAAEDPFSVCPFTDILSCSCRGESPGGERNVLEIKIRGLSDTWEFIFGDESEACLWRDRIGQAADGTAEIPPARREFHKLQPVPRETGSS